MDTSNIEEIDRLMKQKIEPKPKKAIHHEDSGDELSQHTVNKNEEKENLEEIERLLKGEDNFIIGQGDAGGRGSVTQKTLGDANKAGKDVGNVGNVGNVLSVGGQEMEKEINASNSEPDAGKKDSNKSFKKMDLNDSELKEEYMDQEFLNNTDLMAALEKLNKDQQDPLKSEELLKIKHKLLVSGSNEVKRFYFLYSVFHQEKEISELIFDNFKTKVMEIAPEREFKYTAENLEKMKDNSEAVNQVLKTLCLAECQELARDILGISRFYRAPDELIKLSIEHKCFIFVMEMMKKAKNHFKMETKKNSSFSKASRYSQTQSFRNNMVTQLSMKIQSMLSNSLEFYQEYNQANENMSKCLEAREEKVLVKLFGHYYLKFPKNFVKHSILNSAINNDCFLFVKKFFDAYPRSRYLISDFEALTRVIEILDDDQLFIHGVFLLSKVNIRILNEIHIRLILEKYDIFIKKKLLLLTYTLNPIITCVMMIENLRRFQKLFPNVRIRINVINEYLLSVATKIKDQISDEVFIKVLYLKPFYPSQINMLKILYRDKEFYSLLLRSTVLHDIVTKLWYCEFKWTWNFLNSSSAFKNLLTHFGTQTKLNNPAVDRYNLSKMAKGSTLMSSSKHGDQMIPPSSHSQNSSNMPLLDAGGRPHLDPQVVPEREKRKYEYDDKNVFINSDLMKIDFRRPFQFFQKTRFSMEVRYTNHIFSMFFWEKSPVCKVIIEFTVYAILFSLIIWNMFAIFSLRRDFEQFPTEFQHFNDGSASLRYKRNTFTPQFIATLTKYAASKNQTDINYSFKVMASLGDFCLAVKEIIPQYFSYCDSWEKKSDQVWEVCDIFELLQYYFVLCFFHTILEVIFLWKKQRIVSFSLKNGLDLIMFCMDCWILNFVYKHFGPGKRLYFQDNLHDNFKLLEEVMTIFLLFMWLKVIAFLKLTKRFGIIIKIMENMVYELLTFFIILCIMILAFATIFYNIFDKANDDYATFGKTVTSLIAVGFGQVDFTNFKDREITASILINIYAVTIVILLLNLLIAILTNVFNVINEKGSLENANILYQNYLAKKPDKYYSILVSIVPPLNIPLLLIAPLVLYKKRSKVNKIAIIFGFTLYALVYISIYTIVNYVIVIPLCWLKYLFSIMFHLVYRKRQAKGILIWLLWIFIGPFYLLINFGIHDIPLFVKSMYYSSPIKDRLDEITLEEIRLINRFVKDYLSKGITKIKHSDFTEVLKKDLEKINRRYRRQSVLFQKSRAWSVLQSIKNTEKRKTKLDETYDKPIEADKVESGINMLVEVDKMEVYSFLRQFIGVDNMIDVKRLSYLISLVEYCKKFSIVNLDYYKKNRLVNVLQVVECLGVERAIFGIMAEQARNTRLFDNVLKQYVC